MHILVERILNKPIDSNSFVVYSSENGSCIIIDPGTEDSTDLLKFIHENNLQPEYIFLTHEHFDHIWGVNKIKNLYDLDLVCSIDCALKIVDKKKNMSIFYNQLGFETYAADVLIDDDNNCLIWNGIQVEFILTPGHTNASLCILINNHLFTGDTIIKNFKTVVKLPGGSKLKLRESLSLLDLKFAGKQIIVHPGHGESFFYDEIITSYLI